MYFFSELYHEIIKQDIFDMDVWLTKRTSRSKNIFHSMNYHGGDLLFLNFFNQYEELFQLDLKVNN